MGSWLFSLGLAFSLALRFCTGYQSGGGSRGGRTRSAETQRFSVLPCPSIQTESDTDQGQDYQSDENWRTAVDEKDQDIQDTARTSSSSATSSARTAWGEGEGENAGDKRE